MHSMSAVTLVPNLCLTLHSARMMSLCLQRKSHCLPLHCLKWAFLESTGGAPLTLSPTSVPTHIRRHALTAPNTIAEHLPPCVRVLCGG